MTSKTTRRAILAGAAALPILSLPAVTAAPDPALAAIERFNAYDAVANITAEQEPVFVSPDIPA